MLPILYHHCFACHSEKQPQPKGELRLDSATSIRKSKVIVSGKPNDSELLRRVSLPHTDEGVMPPLKGGAQPLNEAERATLRQWIAAGAKLGSWAKFDHRGSSAPAVDAALKDADVRQLSAALQQRVDQVHVTKATTLNPPVSDEVFLRRVYLDVVGRIPSLAESTRFLDSNDRDKRAKLIDELLASEGYVSHSFNWKADLLRVNTRGLAGGQPGKLYDDWVKDAIRSRMPYDEFVRRLITASGQLWENGAVGFYLRDLGMPLDHMSNLTRVFLGTRIECAQCHDHPLEPITQRDFYQMAAFTYGVSNLGSPGGYSNDNVKQWPAIKAKLDARGQDDALAQAVSGTIAPMKRLTSPRNPRFAKNIANRLWKRVMGVGLIEPVDSLSVLPVDEHAELIDFLTQTMIRLKFDERAFLAVLLNTRLYQSDAERATPEPASTSTLRGPQLRRLSAEQEVQRLTALHAKELKELFGETRPMDVGAEAESDSKETDPRWKSLPPSFIRASETPLPLPLGHFLRQFGQSDRREIDAFNRDPNTTQSLALMNGELTTRALAADSFLRRQLAASKTERTPRTQLIFRAILVRSPTAEELATTMALTKDSQTPEQDLIWALLNSPEFLFNH